MILLFLCVIDIGYAWWIFIRFYVEKRIKCEFLFYRLNKSAIFATVDSDTKIKIEVYNSIIFLHNVKK